MQSVDPGVVPVWRIWTVPLALLISIATGIPLFVGLDWVTPLVLRFLPNLALVLAVVGFAWWYPAARYRHLAYEADDNGITIRDGVFFRAESSLAKVRIQHSDVYQGPVMRHFGIATLKLYTAGSNYTCIELEGLAYDDATTLRDQLQGDAMAGNEDAV
ncbi:MAG: PH domain-containing protein [Gammaproteobacteria bacterium]|nr:PH domain-containing protein [Gammaproteobacteria bacterium]